MAVHESIIELLREIDIFSRLREYELDIIARYSTFEAYRKGQVVFRHGEPSEALYVVDKGRIGIISVDSGNAPGKDKGLKKDKDVEIAQIIAKESFGEIEFFGKIPRSATAFAEEDSVLLCFPAKKYRADEIFLKHSYISALMLYRLFGIISERICNVGNMLRDKTAWLQDLHKQLLSDKMTGLYNQRYLEEDFVNLLPSLEKSAAVLMIKPDNFKIINDKYGHDTGDRVLTIMAGLLLSEVGEGNIGIRYRGDEFAAILLNMDKETAKQKAKDIGLTFRRMDMSSIGVQDEDMIKVSMGIAMYPENAGNSRELVELAHRKMTNARKSGGNRIAI